MVVLQVVMEVACGSVNLSNIRKSRYMPRQMLRIHVSKTAMPTMMVEQSPYTKDHQQTSGL
jgi:hypothetical protein